MDRHFIQLEILNELQKAQYLKFKKLNQKEYPSDKFNFHLQKLYKEGLLTKNKNKEYSLTSKGLELSGRLDILNSQYIQQPKISLSVGIFRKEDSEVLVLKRKREPSVNKYAWFDRKFRLGSNIHQELNLLLKEETGLRPNSYNFSGITHIIRQGSGLEIDVILLNYKVKSVNGKLRSMGKDGLNKWMHVEKALAIPENQKIIGFNERLNAYINNRIITQEFIS